MILAATPWLTISINLLLVVFVVVCLLMTLMILMQRPKQEGLGAAFGGGMTDQMFGARTTNVLQRGTVWCASLFFVLALTLAVLIGMKNSRMPSLAESKEAVEEVSADAETDVEVEETIRSLIEELPPTEETSVEETPLEEAPVEETPVEEAPAEEAPADESDAVEEGAEETSGSEENSGQP